MISKYDDIGKGYNSTRKSDPYLTSRLLFHLKPIQEGTYVDIGCGTGNYTISLNQKGYHFIGIDPSKEMLQTAKQRKSKVKWIQGKVENIELESNSIDGAIASLTIHHWADVYGGFKELNRILKPKGKMVVFTSTPAQMKGYWLNAYFPKMLDDSIRQMPEYAMVTEALEGSAFNILETEKYFVHPDLQDKFLYSGKHDPKLYFNQKIRQGISSFSSLSNKQEVKEGLKKMKRDIDSGKIKSVIQSYKNDLGDYIYFIAEKS